MSKLGRDQNTFFRDAEDSGRMAAWWGELGAGQPAGQPGPRGLLRAGEQAPQNRQCVMGELELGPVARPLFKAGWMGHSCSLEGQEGNLGIWAAEDTPARLVCSLGWEGSRGRGWPGSTWHSSWLSSWLQIFQAGLR